MFCFDWLQLTKESPRHWRTHPWKQGFFLEPFLAHSSHSGFGVRRRVLWMGSLSDVTIALSVVWGAGVINYSAWMGGLEGKLLPPLIWLLPLVFSLLFIHPNRMLGSNVTRASWAPSSDWQIHSHSSPEPCVHWRGFGPCVTSSTTWAGGSEKGGAGLRKDSSQK